MLILKLALVAYGATTSFDSVCGNANYSALTAVFPMVHSIVVYLVDIGAMFDQYLLPIWIDFGSVSLIRSTILARWVLTLRLRNL